MKSPFREGFDDELKAVFEQLKGCESEALALGLASAMVGVGFNDAIIEKVISEVKANSAIIRKNRRIRAENKKAVRLQELATKKRLTKAETVEASKLMRQLKI